MSEKVFAISMFKNEEDIAEFSLKHMIDEGVDGLIVADNMSTDSTRKKIEIAQEYAQSKGIIFDIVDDNEVGYHQSRKMTDLARMAVEKYGATWIIPFDCDELWWRADERVGNIIRNTDGLTHLYARITNYFPSALDLPGDNPFETILWRQPEPQEFPKVAFKWFDDAVIQQGNHSVVIPSLDKCVVEDVQLAHFPYRTFEQFKSKARNGALAYKATDLPYDMGAHWRSYGQILEQHGEEALHEVFTSYFWFLSPINEGLVHDPAPYRRWPNGVV